MEAIEAIRVLIRFVAPVFVVFALGFLVAWTSSLEKEVKKIRGLLEMIAQGRAPGLPLAGGERNPESQG